MNLYNTDNGALPADAERDLKTVKNLMKQIADVEDERNDYRRKMKTYWKLVQDLEAEREGWQQEANNNHESARRIMNERDAALRREQAANDRARIHRDCKNAWLNRAQAAEAELADLRMRKQDTDDRVVKLLERVLERLPVMKKHSYSEIALMIREVACDIDAFLRASRVSGKEK